MTITSPDDIRRAPLALWRLLRGFIVTLHGLFGDPADIARKHTLNKKERDLMLTWLRAGEAVLRRLLLIEAAAMPARSENPRAARKAKRIRTLMTFSADAPETWRVSFRAFPAERAGHARGQRAQARRFSSAWPMAERYEALLRVFNNPARTAARLARRLQRAPQRAIAVALYPADAPDLFGRQAFAETNAPTARAIAHWEPG